MGSGQIAFGRSKTQWPSWKSTKGSWEQRTWAGFQNEAGARAGPVDLREGLILTTPDLGDMG